MVICLWHSMKGCVVDTMLVLRKYLFQCFVDSNSTYCHLESSFFAYFLSAAASGDLCRSVGRNWMVSFLPRQLTCHHTQQLIGGKYTNFRQLLVITCELPRQETNHLVTTHAPTQVTTIRSWWGNLTNFWQLLGMACELPRQETDHSVTTHAPTQVTAQQLIGKI